MPRRPPPTALRLIEGPTPPRGYVRHKLPSLPRPTWYPPSFVPKASPSRTAIAVTIRYEDSSLSSSANRCRTKVTFPECLSSLGAIDIPGSPPSSASSWASSTSSGASSRRGSWDFSHARSLPFDVESVLKPLKPVACGPC